MSYFCKIYLCKGRNTDGKGYCGDHTSPLRMGKVPFMPQSAPTTPGVPYGQAPTTWEDRQAATAILDTELATGYDDLNEAFRDAGVTKCLSCLAFDCHCSKGLGEHSLFDSYTESDNE